MNVQPIVKWSGSKRSQAAAIVARMPKEIDTYYEPFCGGCSVLYRLLQAIDIRVGKYVASDINKDLIELWKTIRDMPEKLNEGYAKHWEKFNSQGGNFNWRKDYFNEVRGEYNEKHEPVDFLFLIRTTVNGLVRYNRSGLFNASCHFSRPGIDPKRLGELLSEWSSLLQEKKVEFVCQEYSSVRPEADDFLYLDPPYNSVGRHQMYFGGIENGKFFDWIKRLPCKWLMSFDGTRGETDYTAAIPKDIYVRHAYLDSGGSSFARYLGKRTVEAVRESLYSNYEF